MKRTLATNNEISDWINNRLLDEFEGDYSISRVTPLRKSDSTGCNWTVGVVKGGIEFGVINIIEKAKEKFTLSDESE
jgi:hypothetical protein